MAKISKDYVGESLKDKRSETSYMDGFRFGFGLFIAFLLGWLILAALAGIIAWVVHFRLHY